MKPVTGIAVAGVADHVVFYVNLDCVDYVLENTLTGEKYRALERQVGKMTVTNYSIGDFLIQLKNAALAKNRDLAVVNTNFNRSMAATLKQSGFVSEYVVEGSRLKVKLTFHKKEPLLIDIKLISKPGLRIYMSLDQLKAQRGPSILLLTTSKGVLTSTQAIKSGVGGEVIAEIY